MILWVVEDDDMELKLVLQAVRKGFPNPFRIHVNQDIAWPADRTLPELTPNPGVRQPESAEHLPDIVVLDLLRPPKSGEPPEFVGRSFYERLRQEEREAHKRRSQVIAYSQYRGLICTETFVEECRAVDHHFDEVPKSPGLLVEKLLVARQKVLDGE